MLLLLCCLPLAFCSLSTLQMSSTTPPKQQLHGFTVTYNTDNHISVLTQLYGSIWPKVLPFCITNTFLAILLDVLKGQFGIDLSVSVEAHKFLSLIVAFLIVARANVAIGRYNEARGYLSAMMMKSRELLQNTMVYSSKNTDKKAADWRYRVALRTFYLIRTSMAVMNYQDTKVPGWQLPELSREEQATIERQIYFDNDAGGDHLKFSIHAHRSTAEENMRVPVIMAFQLRRAVHAHNRELLERLSDAEENKLLASVDGFMAGYYDMRKYMTTPTPFPLLQMARTFLFFYVFTVPFALLSDTTCPIAHYIIIFFFTYGFMGIEEVSIELDDPFGSDANDFKNLRMMYGSFEETYTAIRDQDGEEYADRLRKEMYLPGGAPLTVEHQWMLQA